MNLRNMISLGLCTILFFASSGCSKQDLLAKFHLFRAEDELSKAAALKDKKVSYDSRVPYYSKACSFFKDAFDADPAAFTLNRIELAMDACWRSENKENEELFRTFEGQYATAHPQEYEHGDSGVGAVDMGS